MWRYIICLIFYLFIAIIMNDYYKIYIVIYTQIYIIYTIKLDSY